jgi:TrmH family RNA methyltransferase
LSSARARLLRLLRLKKHRRREGAFLAEGERLLDELARSGNGVRFLFGTADRLGWLEERFPDAEICEIAGDGAALFATDHAQGVGCVLDLPAPLPLDAVTGRGRPLLFLDAVADPGNVGTVIRSAEWFGIGGVLLGEGSVDPYNPKAVRATMGAIFRFPVVEGVRSVDLLRLDLPLLALDAAGREMLGRCELPLDGIYVVGNEAHGVSAELLRASRPLAIAGGGVGGESLNAAVAASVLCYELWRLQQLP